MSTFIDGSAAGVRLQLDRTPLVLRAVRDRTTGKWDALNHLEDKVSANEDITVYVVAGTPTQAFWDGRDRKTGRRTGGQISLANYYQMPEQPPAEVVRDNTQWAAWCAANEGKLRELHAILTKEHAA
jgi:hypothetical protein